MDSVQELVSVLSEKGEAMEEMVALLEEEQRCVVELDLPALEENSQKKEAAIGRMKGLNECSSRLMFQTGAEYGISEGVNLSALIAHMDHPLVGEMERMQRGLIAVYDSMERLLSVNHGLVERSIQNMDASLAHIRKRLNLPDTYSGDGRISGMAMEGRIFRREI